MTTKAVLFDAGDVLYHRPRRGSLLAPFLEARGLRPLPRDAAKARALRLRAYAGELTREEFFDAYLELCGLEDRRAYAQGRRILDAEQRDIEPFPDVPETLRRLKDAGLKLGIVTNTFDATHSKRAWFRRFGIADLWDSFATSCELGLCKPGPGIYLAALSPLDLYPEETVFVGHAAAELEGARAVHMATVAFNRDDETVTADATVDRFRDLPRAVRVTA